MLFRSLVLALPEVHFYIAAYTTMAPELMLLSRFENVTLYPNTFPLLVEKLIQQTDVYLDINHDDKLSVVYDYISHFEKPILTFYNTQSRELPAQPHLRHQPRMSRLFQKTRDDTDDQSRLDTLAQHNQKSNQHI